MHHRQLAKILKVATSPNVIYLQLYSNAHRNRIIHHLTPQFVIVRQRNRTNFIIRVTKYFDAVNEIRQSPALAYARFLKVSVKRYNGTVVFTGDTSSQKER
ncbi:MAG: hypothetical protein ACYTBX_02860 [Planctomycetota bacterium]|jgi:hypothetical protein